MIHIISNLFPRENYPSMGKFVEEHALILNQVVATKAIVLKTIFPGINQNWQMYKAKPILSDLPITSIPFFTIPKFKTLQLSRIVFDFYYSKLLKREKPNLVFLHFLYPSVLAAPILTKLNIPFILFAHGDDVREFLKDPKLKSLVETATKHAEKILFPTIELKEDFVALIGDYPNKYDVFPNPIILENDTKLKFKNVNNARKKCITIANISKGKGVERVIDAAKKMSEVNFHIFGALNTDAYSENLYVQICNLENISLHEPVPKSQLHAFLKECDVYLHPSDSEGFGLGVCEALLVGLPVYARKVGVLTQLDEDVALTYFDNVVDSDELTRLMDTALFNKNQKTMKRLQNEFSEVAVKNKYAILIAPYLK